MWKLEPLKLAMQQGRRKLWGQRRRVTGEVAGLPQAIINRLARTIIPP